MPNYHTPLTLNQPGTPATFNAPLATIDTELTAVNARLGANPAGGYATVQARFDALVLAGGNTNTALTQQEAGGVTLLHVGSTTGFVSTAWIGYVRQDSVYEERQITVASSTTLTVAATGGIISNGALIAMMPTAMREAANAINHTVPLVLPSTIEYIVGATTYHPMADGAIGNGVTDDRAVLNTLVNTTMTTGGVVMIDRQYSIQSAMTFPVGVALKFMQNGRLVLLNADVTINGPLEAPLSQIFAHGGTGVVKFGPRIQKLYPEWWGAAGDYDGATGTDDAVAIAACIASADASATAGIGSNDREVKPALYFPSKNGYCSSTAQVIPANISVWMESRLIYTGAAQNATFLTIGQARTAGWTANDDTVSQYYRVMVERLTVSDWTNEASVGVKFINIYWSQIDVVVAVNFTIGAQMLAHGRGFNYNDLRLGLLADNKIALDLKNTYYSSHTYYGWCNDNTFIGGSLRTAATTNPTIQRIGVRIWSDDATPYYNLNNQFYRTSFELNSFGLSIPIQILHGSYNVWRGTHNESNGIYMMTCANSSTGNIAGTDQRVSEQLSDAASGINRIQTLQHWSDYEGHTIFRSGPLHKLACYYDGSSTIHIPGVHLVSQSTAAHYSNVGSFTITDNYLEFTNARGVGVMVDTRACKRFVVRRDVGEQFPPTAMKTAGAAIDTILDVDSTDGMVATGKIAVRRNNPSGMLYTTVSSVTPPNTVQIGAALGGIASVGNVVQDFNVNYCGAVAVRCYDSAGVLMTATTGLVTGPGFYHTTTHGGHVWITSENVSAYRNQYPVAFTVSQDVKIAEIMIIGYPIGIDLVRLRGFSIATLDQDFGYASCWPDYEQIVPGCNIGTTAPTRGWDKNIWARGRTIYHAAPATATTQGWVCVMRVATTATDGEPEGEVNLVVGTITNIASGDIIGAELDNGTMHWTTVNGAPSGSTVVLLAAVPAGRSIPVAGVVFTNRWKALANLA